MRNLFTMDTRDYDINGTVCIRPSARGIVIRDGRVLMIHSIRYDYYKFPGGGIEPGETREEALCREVAEESGYLVNPASIRAYGQVHRAQKGDDTDIFIQDNFYYLCDVSDSVGQHLDDYEAEERFTPEFVTPMQAIHTNRTKNRAPQFQVMLEREAAVLELLMEEGFFERCHV